jgi:hypothetical protein
VLAKSRLVEVSEQRDLCRQLRGLKMTGAMRLACCYGGWPAEIDPLQRARHAGARDLPDAVFQPGRVEAAVWNWIISDMLNGERVASGLAQQRALTAARLRALADE